MDYMTKATSRETLRHLSKLFRMIFNADTYGKFDVINAFETLPEIFKGTVCRVIEDRELPYNIPARCYPDEAGNFTVEIKNSIYLGAYKQGIGAYRGFICHELCHVFLYKIGFTPIFNVQFGNNEIAPYCSVEWQTKALCGEVMMPYEESKGLSKTEIMEKYGVSKGFAEKRLKY